MPTPTPQPGPVDAVYLRPYRSVLFDGDHWSLVRVVDGRTEASGFVAIGEAEQYAAEQGHPVVPAPKSF